MFDAVIIFSIHVFVYMTLTADTMITSNDDNNIELTLLRVY